MRIATIPFLLDDPANSGDATGKRKTGQVMYVQAD